MNFTPEQAKLLSPAEVKEFLSARRSTRDFLSEAALPGIWTVPVKDLILALNSPPGSVKYSRKAIQTVGRDQLQSLSTALGLSPDDPQLVDRTIRIVRMKGLLLDDVQWPIEGTQEVTNIICGRLGIQPCTPLSQKIGSSLIRIAATRIFSDPAQSILELPVNSIDAYSVLNGSSVRVGKFGLGFFSILYYLVMNSQNSLIIDSTYLDPNGEHIRWIGTLTYSELLKLEIHAGKPEKMSGTTIELRGSGLPISHFEAQLEKLRDVQSATLIVEKPSRYGLFKPSPVVWATSVQSMGTVRITLSSSGIRVEDDATGISLSTLYGSLLIPSISTKQISTLVLTPQVNSRTGISSGSTKSQFRLLVGEIMVQSIKYRSEIPLIVTLQMQAKCPLPVSRDDILLQIPWVQEEFLLNVQKLLSDSIGLGPLGPLSLIQGLRQYRSPYLPNLTDHLIEQLQQKYILVPAEELPVYQTLNVDGLLGIDRPLDYLTEDNLRLSQTWNEKIFYGKYVRFIPNVLGIMATTGQSSRLLFLSDRYQNLSSGDLADLSVALGEIYLLPYSMTSSQKENQQLLKLLLIDSPVDLSIAYNLLLQMEGLRTYYLIEESHISQLADCLNKVYRVNQLFFRDIASVYSVTLKQLRPAVAYGGSQPRLMVQFSPQSVLPSDPQTLSFIRETLIQVCRESVKDNRLVLIPLFGFNRIYPNLRNSTEWAFLISLDLGLSNEEADLLRDYWTFSLSTPEKELTLYRYIGTRSYENDFKAQIGNPCQVYLQLIRNTRAQVQSLPSVDPPIPYGKLVNRLTLTQLIAYTFQNTFDPNRFLEILPTIREQSEGFPLQALEIAINEGTTKPWIRSIVTETFQNSLDALRQSSSSLPIEIEIRSTGSEVQYRIFDPVGIPPNGLLSLSIPFLSTKTPSELVTGEMGSGFFNVYRQAKLVRIRTGTVEFRDTPVLNQNRVVDVQREVYYGPSFKGTTIDVYWSSQRPLEDLTEIIQYCRDVLPLATDYRLNGALISIPRSVLFTRGPFTVSQIPNNLISYLLTKGVPFAELPDYIQGLVPDYQVKAITAGFIINISGKGYTPVQSRNKITLSGDLNETVQMTAYLSLVHRQMTDPQADLLYGFLSRADILQLIPSISYGYLDERSFMLNYRFPGNNSLGQALIDLISRVDKYHPTIEPLSMTEYLRTYVPQPEIQAILRAWFKRKRPHVDEPEKPIIITPVVLGPSKTTQPTGKILLDIRQSRFVSAFVDAYWNILLSLNYPNIVPDPSPPRVEWVILNSALGRYDKFEHRIQMNATLSIWIPTSLTPESLLEFFRNEGQPMFGYRYPASILIHELSHAWRKNSHEGNHTDFTLNEKSMNFDQAANYVYQRILERGFLENLIRRYNDSE